MRSSPAGASRPRFAHSGWIGANRGNIHVGPIQPTIIAELREWRHVLAPNDHGIAFDLYWRDSHRQVYRSAYGSLADGRQRHVTAGFESFGEVAGWVEIIGERINLVDGRGTRDRHWGIGRGVGGPRFQDDGKPPKAGWIGGNWFAFKDFAIWGPIVLYRHGDPHAGHGKVTKVERRLQFEDDTKIFLAGGIGYTLAGGEVKRVRFERIGNQTAYMTCGLYGGSPDRCIWQGDHVGEGVVQGDRFDLSDPANRLFLRGLDEHHCRISCDGEKTTGILQPLEPDAFEACVRGDKGWQLLK